MFCPRCSAQNRPEQKFCRQCGLSLPAVRLALEGKIDEAAATIEKDFSKLASGAVTLGIFALIALISSFFSGFNAALNLILGLLIAGPMIYLGLKRLERSIKLIDPKKQAADQIKEPAHLVTLIQSEHKDLALPPVPDTDPLRSSHVPGSVTEQTTLNLEQPVHER
ncbi:MAG: zinc-ribbon domain-containing protein [Acidobacteria bacterium]|nr:zinc-ribbon domain-containing protein [Acidobacteriota bacterium]MCI0664862.1 zinc-ribbon domain-containing protein [Acidobacteriota bacterium]